jgi:hemerythrin superfamily protein
MEETNILDVMVKDHKRLLKSLNDIENNIKDDYENLLESFNKFEWSIEKHFFVEERAIFSYYNPNKIEESHHLFKDITKQHTQILEHIESLRNRLRMSKTIDVSDVKKMLIKHKNLEEKNVYPLLDSEIGEGEKRFMIERINDIKM